MDGRSKPFGACWLRLVLFTLVLGAVFLILLPITIWACWIEGAHCET